MIKPRTNTALIKCFFTTVFFLLAFSFNAMAETPDKRQGPPAVPVKVAKVASGMVSDQISLIGTTEAIAKSTVAAEVSGLVEHYPIKEGDFVNAGDLLVKLKATDLKLRLKAAQAVRAGIKANLDNAEKELERVRNLKSTHSISEAKLDTAFYAQRVLSQRLLQSDAEIEQIEYEISQKQVFAPFSGFVAAERTQKGEWIQPGGPVVNLVDLEKIRITVDVPERYVVKLSTQSRARIIVKSISSDPLYGKIYAILPQGDSNSRTIPVRISLANPDYKIKSGMEAIVTFTLTNKKNALLIPKDAVVMAGSNRLVFTLNDGKVMPVMVNILGYYDGNVAVEGNLKPDDLVVTRGNERLQPGQAVQILP